MLSKAAPRAREVAPHIPPAAERAGTKGRILKVALAQFCQRGYHATSVRDLARELELEAPALYAHFPSKEHVLAELVRAAHEEHLGRIQRALLEAGADPVDQIRAFVRAHVGLHTDYAMLAVLANNELHALSPELAAPSLALRRHSEQLLYELVERGVTQRRFRPPHPWVTAAAIGGMGLRVAHWFARETSPSADEIADAHVDLALRMLGAEVDHG
jgi:AcrR family transcriptional regulator